MRQIAAAILFKPAFFFAEKLPTSLKRVIFFISLLLLFSAEILRVYFIMPFPGSQVSNTVSYAYWLNNYIVWVRIITLAIITLALINVFKTGRLWQKIVLSMVLATYLVTFFLFNFRLEADKIFKEPISKSFTPPTVDADMSKLVIGVVINGEAKAYPIQLIGYHHQVRDSLGSMPVMITYCTVCRTGRAFSPMVNGKMESFRLVGMDHFNAMFEDETTKSWWQQATGVAITGPLKGTALKEIPSAQLPLNSWLRQYPNSLVMQADTSFIDNYFKLEDYDRGAMKSVLVKRDTISWNPKSWIVGVRNGLSSKAYDWNELVMKKVIQDSIAKLPIIIALENDTSSFHVYDRRVNGTVLNFVNLGNDNLIDQNTQSLWNMDGLCIDGVLKGRKLLSVQSYNEFWHAWQTFHKNAETYSSRH